MNHEDSRLAKLFYVWPIIIANSEWFLVFLKQKIQKGFNGFKFAVDILQIPGTSLRPSGNSELSVQRVKELRPGLLIETCFQNLEKDTKLLISRAMQ